MAAETHPSSSSSSDNYDVFLSFRGEDTRGNFTDHLYTALVHAGIRTFRDNEELHHGEEIGLKLLKSIEQSRISIPIFSKNYASSKWCLQELIKIMECKKTCGQIVLPIFYKVEPTHVRKQTGCFEEAFLKHEKEQCEETVRAWRQALEEAGNLKGWDSEDPEYRYETNLINSVVERALSVLSIKTNLQVAVHPTGIDSHVKEVERMLDFQSEGVQFVGIHGMGGIGKTTTAKAVFNTISNQFKISRFLEDVREKASQYQGLVNLQKELVSDLFKGKNPNFHSVSSGIDEIKKLFRNIKVLIVLDDVDQDEQLRALAGKHDWFGSGSRIIITTRDEHILRVDQVDKSKIYKPKELDGILSLQLFSKHAFGRDQPPQEFMDLSKKVVSILGGLPLAIEVVGSSLRDEKEHTFWEDTLKKLERSPEKKVQEQLKISYTRLDLYDQKLFLDIACFFIGVDIESVIPAWQACGYFPRRGIKVLVDKSLVKIDNDNKLRMHDQLRDMGREIVRQENPKKPGERSRLWSHKEALEVLKEYKGTRNVEGLFLDFGYQAKNHWTYSYYKEEKYSTDSDHEAGNYLTDCDHEAEKLPQIDPADLLTKAFEKMSDLRLLQVDHADHDGNKFGHLPPGLKWLSLKGISCKCVPAISHVKELAVLDLSSSNITDDWDGWQQIQSIRTLKVLDLSSCYFLKRTPHFPRHTGLERLILDWCTSLAAFHESIGYLQKLVFLSLKHCRNLMELPDSICELSSIRSIILSDCYKIEKLPKELGNMESLTELIIDRTRIEEIPDSIGLLEKLEILSATGCENLMELPDNICKLSSIRSLILSDCYKLEKLPKELGNMESLTELIIDKTRIEEIPDSIGLLEKLERLSATGCENLTELPDSICKLSSIRSLILSNCYKLEKLPKELGNMESLTELIIDSTRIEEIPDSIGYFKKLERLSARWCRRLVKLPHSMGTMESLTELIIEQGTRNVEGLFLDFGYEAKNHSIDFDYKAFKVMSDPRLLQVDHVGHHGNNLGHLPQGLKWLSLKGISCKCVPTISHVKKLAVLDLSRSNITDDWDGWQQIQLIRTLKVLDLSSCYFLKRTPHFPRHTGLERLILDWCTSLVAFHESIGYLQKLIFLSLKHCKNLMELPDSICELSSIRSIILSDCYEIEKLPKELGNMESLTELIIDRTRIEEIPDSIGYLKKLERLSARGCKNLTELPDSICKLSSIRSLILSECFGLKKLPKELGNMESLTELIIDQTRIEEIPDSIGLLEKLERLSAWKCENLTELPDSICKPSSIRNLNLSWCKNLEKLPKELGKMESLTELIIDRTRIEEIPDSIGLLEKLERLSATGCENLTELPDSICKLSSIRSLILSYCNKLEKLPKELGNMESLTELIIDSTRIKEIPDSIGYLKKLERLSARLCRRLVKLPHSMGTMESLTELNIEQASIQEIPGSIGLLEKLERLTACSCKRLEKLPNLSNLKSLQELNLYECWELLEIQGICGLSLLHQLDLKNCKTLKFLPELPPGLIKLNISGCTSMERLPKLSSLKSLKELRFDKCYKLAKIEGIDGLTLLQEFDFTDCRKLQSLPELPSSLIKLEIKGCTSMERLPKLSSLKSLKVLHVEVCMDLANIQGIKDLTLLQELDLGFYSKIQSLSELPSSLTRIHVYHCQKLSEIQGFSNFSLLQTLHLDSCQKLQSLDLSNLKILKSLCLQYCRNLAEIRGLESLESLIELLVYRCYTYVQTLPKSVAKGMLPTAAFKERLISKTYLIPDDDNIKGTIFYFVYQLFQDPYPLSFGFIHPDFFIEAEIQRNDGNKTIKCFHDLSGVGMNENTEEDQFYSCYFQGLTWFGFPLKKRDKIYVKNARFQKEAQLKMFDLVMEYKAMEDSQQLAKRVVPLITSTTKKRRPEYDDADYQKNEYEDAYPSSWIQSKIHFKGNFINGE